MGSYTLSVRRSLMAAIATAVLAATSHASLAVDCHDQQTSGPAPQHKWYLDKARIFERHATRLVQMQTQALLLSYADNQSPGETVIADTPNDRLRQAIADQETRARFAVEAMMRSETAHRDWHLLVRELAKAYGTMSWTSEAVADLIDAGHIDEANAVHRARSMDLYNQIERVSNTLTANIEDAIFQWAGP